MTVHRLLCLLLPACLGVTGAAGAVAEPAPAVSESVAAAANARRLVAALKICWEQRGIRFETARIAARIGGMAGAAALAALAGAAEAADGEGVETAVEILWEAGARPSPAAPLLARDLAAGLPLLALDGAGRWWLLTGLDGEQASLRDPVSGETHSLNRAGLALIGRPVIAGA